MKTPENYVCIGRLGKTYQLKGGLRFYADIDDSLVLSLERVFIEGIGESDVRELKQVGNDSIIYLTHALTKEQAQKLVNHSVYVHADVLPEESKLELIGLPVFLEGHSFGHVVDIQEGLQDLLVVESSKREFLVPLNASYVRIEDKAIFLERVPEGLLE